MCRVSYLSKNFCLNRFLPQKVKSAYQESVAAKLVIAVVLFTDLSQLQKHTFKKKGNINIYALSVCA